MAENVYKIIELVGTSSESSSPSSTRITARRIVFVVFPQPLPRAAGWQRTNARP
jgi:hypothetical protein